MDMVDTVPMDTQDMTAAESVVENANAAKSCEAVPMEPKDTYIPAAPVEETSSQLLKAGPLKTQDVLEAHAEENEKEKLLKARTLILGESPSGKGFGLSGGPPAGDAGPASGEVAQHAGQKEETVDGFGGEEQFEPPRVSDSEQAQGGEKESKNLEKGKIEKGEHKDPEKPEETVVIEEKVKNKELEHKGPEKPEETVPSGSAASKRSEELKNEDGSDSSGGGPALPTVTRLDQQAFKKMKTNVQKMNKEEPAESKRGRGRGRGRGRRQKEDEDEPLPAQKKARTDDDDDDDEARRDLTTTFEALAEEEQGKEAKTKKTRQPKAKAKGKAKPKAKGQPKAKAKGQPKAKAKGQAKAKAKGQAKSKAKGQPVEKPKRAIFNTPARKSKTPSEETPDPAHQEDAAKRAKGPKKKNADKATFAGRYPPSNEAALGRFNALCSAYRTAIEPLVKSGSRVEVHWFL